MLNLEGRGPFALLVAGLLGFALVTAISQSRPASANLAPSLSLNPSSGNAPSVSGNLSGSGWCTPSEATYPRVTGAGVSGTVSLTAVRGGSILTGNFTVQGVAGQSVVVTVQNRCPPPPAAVALQPIHEFASAAS